MQYRLLTLVALAIALALATGCRAPKNGEAPSTAAPDPATDATEASSTLRVITSPDLPERPARIVSLAPSITEILYAVGAGERVVAVTRFCDFPPQAEALPKIGGMLDPDVEAIVATKPDLVMGVIAGSDSKVAERLERFGIAYAFMQVDTFDDTYASIERVGALVGLPDAANSLAGELRREVGALSERYRTGLRDRGAEAPSVLVVYDHQPIVAAGRGTFGQELVELAGGQNAAGGLEGSYPVLDVEQILALDPQIIIDATIGKTDAQVHAFWARYDTLAAVRDGRVARFADPVLMRPGPRLGQALTIMGDAVTGSR